MRFFVRTILSTFVLACSPNSGSPANSSTAELRERENDARDLLDAMFIENRTLSLAVTNGFEKSGADIWAGWSSDTGFGSIGETRRLAIRRYLHDEYPRESTGIVLDGAPQALDAAAPRLAALLTREEMLGFVEFLRSDEGRSWFAATVASGDDGYEPTPAEGIALDSFSASAGRAWTPEVNRLIYEIVSDLVSSRSREVREHMATRVCEIAAEDCPPGFVASIAGAE